VEVRTLIEHARGQASADLLQTNARVVDVLGGQIVRLSAP
jgi:adenine deaminase